MHRYLGHAVLHAAQVSILAGHRGWSLNPALLPGNAERVRFEPAPVFDVAIRPAEHAAVLVAGSGEIGPDPVAPRRDDQPSWSCRRLFSHAIRCPLALAGESTGSSRPARRAMRAPTTSSSTNVNAATGFLATVKNRDSPTNRTQNTLPRSSSRTLVLGGRVSGSRAFLGGSCHGRGSVPPVHLGRRSAQGVQHKVASASSLWHWTDTYERRADGAGRRFRFCDPCQSAPTDASGNQTHFFVRFQRLAHIGFMKADE